METVDLLGCKPGSRWNRANGTVATIARNNADASYVDTEGYWYGRDGKASWRHSLGRNCRLESHDLLSRATPSAPAEPETGKVDLSVCLDGDVCEFRDYGDDRQPFRGPWEDRPDYYRVGTLEGRYTKNGQHCGAVNCHLDIVRVTRNGIQITPAAPQPASADAGETGAKDWLRTPKCANCGYPTTNYEAACDPCLQRQSGLEAVIKGQARRVDWLTKLLNEAVEFIEAGTPELGSDEWVWLIVASAAASNKCVKCSEPCDEEGDCVSPECCFGRSKLTEAAKG